MAQVFLHNFQPIFTRQLEKPSVRGGNRKPQYTKMAAFPQTPGVRGGRGGSHSGVGGGRGGGPTPQGAGGPGGGQNRGRQVASGQFNSVEVKKMEGEFDYIVRLQSHCARSHGAFCVRKFMRIT